MKKKVIKKAKVRKTIKDLKNINLLREQITDEMKWLEDKFLDSVTPYFILWRNTNAEERFNNLQSRLNAL